MVVREKNITLKYDTSIAHKLREKVNEKVNIIIKINSEMNKNNKTMRYDAWNRICACMDRIEDTISYLNGFKLGENKDCGAAFDFYEFINYSYVVIECIDALCKIFKVNKELLSFKDKMDIFGDRFNGIGSDEKYFNYIRSLAVVHPVKTNRHDYIPQNEALQCSPFVRWIYKPIILNNRELYDLEMMVYSSDSKTKSQFIPLSINQFDVYLSRWINVVNNVIQYIDLYNYNYIESFKRTPVKNKKDFTNIIDYLYYLKNETKLRFNNDADYLFDWFITVFSTDVSSKNNKLKLMKYRNAIEYSLVFLSNSLQNMSLDGYENSGIKYEYNNFETTLYHELERCYNYSGNFKKYSYELSKCYMLTSDYYDYYDKMYARDLINKIIPELSKYVEINGNESNQELALVVKMALYLESLETKCCINMNIPNETRFRLRLLTNNELNNLYEDVKE